MFVQFVYLGKIPDVWAANRRSQPSGRLITHTSIDFIFGAGRGANPQGTKYRRILSSQAGSDPFGKFSTVLLFSTYYKTTDRISPAWK